MRLFGHGKIKENASAADSAGGDYARLITDNLQFIEKQCRRAVLKGGPEDCGNSDNEADELLNEVLDRLKADDFKALREFQGKAKLTTYITTIISNLVIDLIRQKKGRSRAKERSREMGEVGERLYELVYERGCSLHEAHAHLEVTHGIVRPLEMLQEMLERIRGRERGQLALAGDAEDVWLVPGRRVVVDDEPALEVVDPRKNAEALVISGQKRNLAQTAVAGMIAELSGEDRLMLTMRFPDDEEQEPKSVKEIASLLDLSEKSVDGRIRRILLRFREMLLSRGLGLKDLIDA